MTGVSSSRIVYDRYESSMATSRTTAARNTPGTPHRKYEHHWRGPMMPQETIMSTGVVKQTTTLVKFNGVLKFWSAREGVSYDIVAESNYCFIVNSQFKLKISSLNLEFRV